MNRQAWKVYDWKQGKAGNGRQKHNDTQKQYSTVTIHMNSKVTV